MLDQVILEVVAVGNAFHLVVKEPPRVGASPTLGHPPVNIARQPHSTENALDGPTAFPLPHGNATVTVSACPTLTCDSADESGYLPTGSSMYLEYYFLVHQHQLHISRPSAGYLFGMLVRPCHTQMCNKSIASTLEC